MEYGILTGGYPNRIPFFSYGYIKYGFKQIMSNYTPKNPYICLDFMHTFGNEKKNEIILRVQLISTSLNSIRK